MGKPRYEAISTNARKDSSSLPQRINTCRNHLIVRRKHSTKCRSCTCDNRLPKGSIALGRDRVKLLYHRHHAKATTAPNLGQRFPWAQDCLSKSLSADGFSSEEKSAEWIHILPMRCTSLANPSGATTCTRSSSHERTRCGGVRDGVNGKCTIVGMEHIRRQTRRMDALAQLEYLATIDRPAGHLRGIGASCKRYYLSSSVFHDLILHPSCLRGYTRVYASPCIAFRKASRLPASIVPILMPPNMSRRIFHSLSATRKIAFLPSDIGAPIPTSADCCCVM